MYSIYWHPGVARTEESVQGPGGTGSLSDLADEDVKGADRHGVEITAVHHYLPSLFSVTVLFQFVPLPRVLTFILILFMFMFKTSTPSSAKTLKSRPCLSPKRPSPGSSDPLIKPSSPAVCPEPSSSPKHVSPVTPRTGGSGAKEMKVKVRKTPLERIRLL